MLSNLVGNALTYGSKDWPVRIEASARSSTFELSVSNRGEAIAPAAIAHLFEPFFRAAVSPRQQALGLGLYIAAEIARAHGGTLVASSMPEETKFTFQMPLMANLAVRPSGPAMYL